MYNNFNQRKLRNIFGRATDDPNPSPHNPSNITSSPATNPSNPNAPAAYRPSVAQNAVFHASTPILTFDSSPDGRAAILGGRHILKTVHLDGLTIREGIDLRALIKAQAATKSANNPSNIGDQLSIKDVKWGTSFTPGGGEGCIFTACASGKIFRYDLHTAQEVALHGGPLSFVQIREDSRQVNALDINPHRGTLLLSGSQDGIVRCFDIRTPMQTSTGITFKAQRSFKCNADGVRHVQWSPKDGFEFACATEQGVVMKWDLKMPKAPTLRINAHMNDKMCSAMAWHPDGEHLMSAGWDCKCHVWDMKKDADKRQKPKYTISTPAPVSALAWRPGQWSATAGARRAAQVAISYDESSQKRLGTPLVHIWDLARPTMPFKEIQRFDNSPNALLWHDQGLLWTAGQDGLFNQCDVAFAPKVIDRQAVSTMAFSSRGDVLMFLDGRPRARRHHSAHSRSDSLPAASYSTSPMTPMLSMSRSDSEDDVVGSFLGPRKKAGKNPRPSTRSTAVSTTPPYGSNLENVMSLDQTIKVTGTYRPQQAMAVGHLPAGAQVDIYEYLTLNYLETLYSQLPYEPGGPPLVERVCAILEHYARAAESVNKFRLAQTWRILAYATDLLLRKRAQYHLEYRMEQRRNPSPDLPRTLDPEQRDAIRKPFALSLQPPPESLDGFEGQETPRKVPSSTSLQSGYRPLLSNEMESTSNMPTPIARPIDAGVGANIGAATEYSVDYHPRKMLTPIVEPDSFSIGSAILGRSPEQRRRRLDSAPLSITSQESELSQASTEGYDFYDTEAISQAMDVPGQKKPPVSPQYADPPSPNARRKPPITRHDSDESVGQIFSLSQGSRRTSGLTGSSQGSSVRRVSSNVATPSSISRTGSDLGDGEYASRNRGKQMMEESPHRNQQAARRSGLERAGTGMTNFTDEYHLITQTTSDSFNSRDAFPSPTRQPPTGAPHFSESLTPHIIETDYLPWPSDPDYPFRPTNHPPPVQPYALISRALQFESTTSALNASAMILLLKPLLPSTIIDSFRAASILRAHHARLSGMQLFVQAALLRKMAMKGWPGDPLQNWGENYPAVFGPALQNVQVGFTCSSCHKAREIDRSGGSTESVWTCKRCKEVMAGCAVCGHRDETPNSYLREQGKGKGKEEEEEEEVLTTWWFCPGCGHGGHSTCLAGWHDAFAEDGDGEGDGDGDGDGCCPLDGCGHACLPGSWRADCANVVRRSEAVREATRVVGRIPGGLGLVSPPERNDDADGVRMDGDVAMQSKAVESVRGALGSGGGLTGSGGAMSSVNLRGILGSSPGRSGGFSGMGGSSGGSGGGGGGERDGGRDERERRKSVKFASGAEAVR